MKILNRFTWTFVSLLVTAVLSAEANDSFFHLLEPEQNITGKNGTEFKTRSPHDCAFRCLDDRHCLGYQLDETLPGSCILIQNCSDGEELVLGNDNNSIVFEKFKRNTSEGTWGPPNCWPGPEAAFYRSFDSPDGLVLMGIYENVPLVSGNMNLPLRLNRTQEQWVDLGIHTEACMTRPETCGAAGGTVSLWVNLNECYYKRSGIVSSIAVSSSGFYIGCSPATLGTGVFLPDGYFSKSYFFRPGWKHIVLNYIGPNEGITLYRNANQMARDTTKDPGFFPTRDGRIVVGRRYTDINNPYISVMLDEFIFFNRALNSMEIQSPYEVL